MPENEPVIESTVEKVEPKIMSMGKPERVVMPTLVPNNTGNQGVPEETNTAEFLAERGTGDGVTVKEEDAAIAQETPVNNQQTAVAPTFTDEQLTNFFKEKGIEFESIDKLKEKLNGNTSTELTDAQKQEQAKSKEKKLVDIFLKGNPENTIDKYVAIKNIAEMDVAELSLSALKKEYKDAKFSDEEIEGMIKEEYFQIS
ncbi:MAG: hypothetical protein WKF91_22205, partial [Segetibacter sp.]